MASKMRNRQAGHGLARGPRKPRTRHRPALESFEPRLLLSGVTMYVDSTTDTGSGSSNVGDLRYCITIANEFPGSTIDFEVTGTDALDSSLPAISSDITIVDSDPGTFTIEGGGPTSNFNALTINGGVTASISGLNFTDFESTSDGAILDVEGTLTLAGAILSNSATTGNGGGVVVNGSMTAEGCTFESLSAGSEGLGGAIGGGGSLTVIGGSFTSNSAEDGGAIGSTGTLDVNGVLFANNTASYAGGAIYSYAATITNSTIASNSAADYGGGIEYNSLGLMLTNDTIAENSLPSGHLGAGVYASGTVSMFNTIVAQNLAGSTESDLDSFPGPGGGSISAGSSYNLIGDTTISGITDGSNGNMIGTSADPIDAMLGPLADNGGASETMAPQAGSPAIGAGQVSDAVDPTTSDSLPYDQRGAGYSRVVSDSVDIGAYQTQSTTAASTLAVSTADGTYGGTTSLSAMLSSGSVPVAGEEIDFHIGAVDLGQAMTNSQGIATISDASLTGIDAGTYAGTVTASFVGDSNFEASSGSADLDVAPAPLTITAVNQSKMYGAAMPTLTVSYSGFVNGDTASSLESSPTLVTTANASSHVAGGPYAITASGAVDPNYTITYASGSLSITAAPLTITANSQTKVYGAAIPTLTASYTGLVNGDTSASLATPPTIVTTATSSSHVAGGPYAVYAGGAVDTDYAISYVPGNLSVAPASLTIIANDQVKVYGAALPTLTASYSGFVNGDTSASLIAPPVLSSGASAFSPVEGSPYAITPSGAFDPDYSIGYDPGSLLVTPAPLTIVIDDLSKVYGQAVPELTGTVTGILNGDDVVANYATPASQYSDVQAGGYPITFVLGGASASNYSTTVIGASVTNGSLDVTPAPLTVVIDDQSKVYGQADPELTGMMTGILNDDDVVASYATMAMQFSDVQAGGYPINFAGLSGEQAIDYSTTVEGGSVADGTLDVTPAPLTVVVANHSKTYGQANPTPTGVFVGAFNGDDVGVVYGTTASRYSDVKAGGYPITPIGLTGAKAGDYSLSVEGASVTPGTLTIAPAPLAIVANGTSKVYGQAVPALTGTVAGLLDGDTIAEQFATTATASSHVVAGGYPIVLAGISGAKAGDYTVTSSIPGTLAVTPAPLTVAANNQVKVYGQANPAFTASYGGFVLGQGPASLSGVLTFSTTASAASHVGLYDITPGGLTSTDYAIRYLSGAIAVTPAPLVVSGPSFLKSYGQAVPSLTVTFAGFVNGDTPANLTTPVSFSTTLAASSHVGLYPVFAGGASSPDYAITYKFGVVGVMPALLIAVPTGAVKAYGQPVPSLSVAYYGFVNGDTTANLTTPVTVATTATASSAPGVYPVYTTGGTARDYLIYDATSLVDVVAPPPPPPVLNAGQVAFVTSLYEEILGRAPESFGVNAWINQLNQGVTRASVAQQIYRSPEAVAYRALHRGRTVSLATALSDAQKAQLKASQG